MWATIHKPTGTLIGRCGLLPWTIAGHHEVEVAYLLARAHWGQGLATEAARAIVHYAFGQLHLTRLICLIDSQHRASHRVAEKIGMTFEKAIVDDKGPALVYAMGKLEARSTAARHGEEPARGSGVPPNTALQRTLENVAKIGGSFMRILHSSGSAGPAECR